MLKILKRDFFSNSGESFESRQFFLPNSRKKNKERFSGKMINFLIFMKIIILNEIFEKFWRIMNSNYFYFFTFYRFLIYFVFLFIFPFFLFGIFLYFSFSSVFAVFFDPYFVFWRSFRSFFKFSLWAKIFGKQFGHNFY